jgi:hypothetical protein
MTKQKLSVSERIRKQLDLGKTPKEISKYLKCSTGLVYAVRAAEKKKLEAVKPKVGYTSTKPILTQEQHDTLNTLTDKPGAIRYGNIVMVPKDYEAPKRNIIQRFFNWICGG